MNTFPLSIFFTRITILLFIGLILIFYFYQPANAEVVQIETVWMLNPDPNGLKYLIATLYLVETFEETPCGAVGCFRYADYTIWVVNGSEGYGGGYGFGCSVLYHEILHGMGYPDWYIKYHYPDWRCAVGNR